MTSTPTRYAVVFIGDSLRPRQIIGKPCRTRSGAFSKQIRLDNAYGAYRHTIVTLTHQGA